MRYRAIKALHGPNIWSNGPVIEAWIDLGGAGGDNGPDSSAPGWVAAVLSNFDDAPGGAETRRAVLARVGPGARPSEVVAHLAAGLLTLDGSALGPAWVRPIPDEACDRIAVAFGDEPFGLACLESALAMTTSAESARPGVAADAFRRLRDLAAERWPGPIVVAMLEAARRRDIPVDRPYRDLEEFLIVLGHGRHQRRCLLSKSDRDGAVAESLSANKELTKAMLRDAGLAIPEGRPVADAEEAWRAASELGTPVVVKPMDADYGWGVSLKLTTRQQVTDAYAVARERSEHVLVEKQVEGLEYRLLVVADRLVAATLRMPPEVVGDGRSTVAQLIEAENRDPRRGMARTAITNPITVDADALAVLAEQGHSLDTVPEGGAHVFIRHNAHRWAGGITVDVTDLVHPEVAAQARDAARVVGLDVAGIDVVTTDIGRPLPGQGGAIIEVNAGPALGMHLRPASGKPRPVAQNIVDMLFPEGETGRIPVVAVLGARGATSAARLITRFWREAGRTVGLACADGAYVDSRPIRPGSARTILLHPRVEAAVFEASPGEILTDGLGFDRCEVAVVTHLGVAEPSDPTLDDLTEAGGVLIRAVVPGGAVVLNADDPKVAAMARWAKARVIAFAVDGDCPEIARRRADGECVLFVRDGMIVRSEGGREEAPSGVDRISPVGGNPDVAQVENVLAAVAAAWALSIPWSAIRAGLQSPTGTDE